MFTRKPRRASRGILRFAAFGVALAGSAATPSAAQSTHVGLSSVRAQWFGNEPPPPSVPHPSDLFAFALVAGDFDGDGADDLATSISRYDCMQGAGAGDCGAVLIRYGALGGGLVTAPANQLLSQEESGSPNSAEPGDLFGSALAACDFDGDGFDDLAVGVPGEDLTLGGTIDIVDSGIVEIYYGGESGLATPASAVLSSNGIQAAHQRFGQALACGRIDAGPFDDLVVGIPGATVNSFFQAGRIRFYPGSAAGIGTGAISIDQDSTNMAGVAEAGDAFGEALPVFAFNAGSNLDLAIGAPGENARAGAVHMILGGTEGPHLGFNFLFLEDALGGAPEAGDEFGHALAAGDFDLDGFGDLAIGVPFEDLGSADDTGNVGVVYGQAAFGPPFARSQGFDQDAVLGPGNTESGDRFGWALASGDFDGDGVGDLAIGHPFEDNSGASNGDADGGVTVLLGVPAAVLSPARRRHFVSGLEGVPGEPAEHAKGFGRALAAGDFDGDGHGDLAIGMPNDDEGGLVDVGSVVVLYGALFADGFESASAGYWSETVPHP
jgi:hypothetical protein